MFGANEIVGKAYFKDSVDTRKMFVTSMFMTLQGEGPYRGLPAFFIRLAKCNLNCSFCDTFFDDGDWMTFEDIEVMIDKTIKEFYESRGLAVPEWTQYHETETSWRPRQMVLVMTGGEPMLQENIGDFLEWQQTRFKHTQIESNGTQNTRIPNSTTLVISPKCLEKNGKAIKYLTVRKEVLERADCLKFVMEHNEDSPYNVVPEFAHEWHKDTGRPIFCSPMNIYNDIPQNSKTQRANSNSISLTERSTVDEVISFWEPGLLNMEENQKNHEYVAQYCMINGFILNLQIHLYASLA